MIYAMRIYVAIFKFVKLVNF